MVLEEACIFHLASLRDLGARKQLPQHGTKQRQPAPWNADQIEDSQVNSVTCYSKPLRFGVVYYAALDKNRTQHAVRGIRETRKTLSVGPSLASPQGLS